MAHVSGEHRFAAPPARVYELLTDPDVIASGIPAVRSHRIVDDDHWNAKVKPPLPLAPSVTIHFEVLDRRADQHAALHAHGAGADATSTFDLAPYGDGTLMRWETEIHLSGILDRFAGSSLDAAAQRQAARMLDAVERRLAS